MLRRDFLSTTLIKGFGLVGISTISATRNLSSHTSLEEAQFSDLIASWERRGFKVFRHPHSKPILRDGTKTLKASIGSSASILINPAERKVVKIFHPHGITVGGTPLTQSSPDVLRFFYRKEAEILSALNGFHGPLLLEKDDVTQTLVMEYLGEDLLTLEKHKDLSLSEKSTVDFIDFNLRLSALGYRRLSFFKTNSYLRNGRIAYGDFKDTLTESSVDPNHYLAAIVKAGGTHFPQSAVQQVIEALTGKTILPSEIQRIIANTELNSSTWNEAHKV